MEQTGMGVRCVDERCGAQGADGLLRRTDYTTETDGTTMFSIYILGSDTEKPCTVTVSAYAADGTLLKAHTFTDVPIRNNYRTVYRGRFFKDTAFSSTFQVEVDWLEYDEVAY